ncbi:MAG: hypothetical protein QG657_3921 [Acidobacteriota bacterium]|nr:hypothetical protein [Acidobacteriota bacterium]
MFNKLTKFNILEEEKESEEKMENVKGGFIIGPLPYPTPIDGCVWACLPQCYGDPIEGAGELSLTWQLVY